MKPLPHQTKFAQLLWNLLVHTKGYALLQGLPRSGKTLTSLLAIEKSNRVKSVLILTKKSAISGWTKFTQDQELTENYLTKQYTVTNYEAIGSTKKRTETKSGKPLKKPILYIHLKLNPEDYDIIICDESHVLGKLGKPSNRYKVVKELIGDKPVIYLSGTAYIESPNSIYYSTTLSTRNPFPQYPNFYRYFGYYGIPGVIYTAHGEATCYKKAKPELLEYIDSFSVYMTQDDAGITTKSEDKLHYVNLSNLTRAMYNQLQTDLVLQVPGHPTLIADTSMKLRTSLHMMESGVLKIDDAYITLTNTEKIDYLKSTFKMSEHTVVLANYIGEQRLLRKHFPKCTVESATAKAEGVDYSWAHEFILFSSGWSGSKHVQRVERIINVGGSNTNMVHHILVKDAISDQVHQAVSQKKDFNTKQYYKKDL